MIKKYLEKLKLTKPSQIKALLNLLQPLWNDGAIDNIKSLLDKKYKIAVVANMSAGKSTFINAMFADDILPAYSEATTDCPIYIYSDDNPENDKAIIEFTDARTPIELNKKDVKKELKLYAKKDSKELADKYKDVYKIHLYWDFLSLQNSEDNHLNFIFIDTPGPNNTDEFQDKHHSITKNIILKEADMVLYLFDYRQIDSNLEATKGNIWDLIKQRKEKDENFEAFFIINKIDMAFEDNRKLSKIKSSKNRDEFYQNLKEIWFHHENKAVNKIKKAAIKYGFSNPKVFTTSSEYQKLMRMKEVSFDDEDKLDVLKKLFKGIFKENWKAELSDYLRLNYIEDSTRLHIKVIEQKVIKSIYQELENLFNKLYSNSDSVQNSFKQILLSDLSKIKNNESSAIDIKYNNECFEYRSKVLSITIDMNFITIISLTTELNYTTSLNNISSVSALDKDKYYNNKITIKTDKNTVDFNLPRRYMTIYFALKEYVKKKRFIMNFTDEQNKKALKFPKIEE